MWWNLLLGIVLNFVSFLLRPKPEPPPASTLADVNIPITKEGTEFGKVYGTVWIDSALIHWYGDFKSVPIRKKSGKK